MTRVKDLSAKDMLKGKILRLAKLVSEFLEENFDQEKLVPPKTKR